MHFKEVDGEQEVVCEACGGFAISSLEIAKRWGECIGPYRMVPIWACSMCFKHETVDNVDAHIAQWNKMFSMALTAFYGQLVQHLQKEPQ